MGYIIACIASTAGWIWMGTFLLAEHRRLPELDSDGQVSIVYQYMNNKTFLWSLTITWTIWGICTGTMWYVILR